MKREVRPIRAASTRSAASLAAASNALWKYVNVRRLFISLEQSIYKGTQWVVFELNGAHLWARA
jgi:phage tail sheath protein FI